MKGHKAAKTIQICRIWWKSRLYY